MMAATTWDTGFVPEDDCDLTLSTDVLVIGGGPAVAWAAWSAATSGAKVVVVDKGYLGSSGAAAASGNGVLAVPPTERPEVVMQRYRQRNGLGNPRWIERVLECTWQSAAFHAPSQPIVQHLEIGAEPDRPITPID